MAAERISLKRKPFSDCTNTVSGRADTVRRKSSLRSALNQPPKSFSENSYEAPLGSLKSNTSTGSNTPPISTSARSTLFLPASHGSENQERKKRKVKAKAIVEDTAVIQPDHQETIKRKDKGKAVVEDTIVIQPDYQETIKRKDKGKAVVEDTIVIQPDYQETIKRKDKGKAVVEDTIVIQLDYQETIKRKDKGKAVVEDAIIIQPDHQETIKRKDKGKAILEDNTVIQPDHQETIKRKDKGKAIVEDTIVIQPDHQETIKKDKGKAVIEDTTVFHPDPPSATVSGSSYADLFKCRTVYTRKRVPEARNLRSLKITEPFSCPPLKRLKDKGKQVDGGGDGKSGVHRDSFSVQKKKSRSKSKNAAAVDAMPKEEVEKLRAYYADIDAFELDVEEAKAYDSD